MSEWQTIATVTKEGRKMRLRRTRDGATFVCQCYDRDGWTHVWTWHTNEWQWIPLPPAPVDAQGQDA